MKYLTLFVLLALLAGCQSVPDTPAQNILGAWQPQESSSMEKLIHQLTAFWQMQS